MSVYLLRDKNKVARGPTSRILFISAGLEIRTEMVTHVTAFGSSHDLIHSFMVFAQTLNMQFHVGQRFSSSEELQDFISDFDKRNSFNLIRRDSKMLESAVKTKPRRLEDVITSSNLKLCCNFGGKAHKKQTTVDKQRRLTQ